MWNLSLNPKWFTFLTHFLLFSCMNMSFAVPSVNVHTEEVNCLQSWALQLEQWVMFLSLEMFCLFCSIGSCLHWLAHIQVLHTARFEGWWMCIIRMKERRKKIQHCRNNMSTELSPAGPVSTKCLGSHWQYREYHDFAVLGGEGSKAGIIASPSTW